jgi:aldehyde:ferredoxin oxidoreductase
MCCFVGVPIGKLEMEPLMRFLNGVTGWDMSLWELLKAAERSSALFRLYNHREDLATAADNLPDRFFEPLEGGNLQGEKLDRAGFRRSLRTYYQMMGWNADTGLPTPETCAELEIDWALETAGVCPATACPATVAAGL